MFSMSEKKKIAAFIEEILLDLEHPEMPKEKPNFKIHIDGKERWSWADIEPNWKYENKKPGVNPWNEGQKAKLGLMLVEKHMNQKNNKKTG